MSTDEITSNTVAPTTPAIVPHAQLHSGDRLSREEFHRLYEQMPEDFKAELIGGIVYVTSPLSLSHGQPHLLLGALLAAYQADTPGVSASDNTTVLLGDDGEPQPDLLLRVLPEHGGQSSTTDNQYVKGAPELVIEIAHSSRAIDLHAKKDDYARHGVKEYLVLAVRDELIFWFDLTAGKQMTPDAEGVYRIATFPGLWISGPALLANDYAKLMATLHEGMAAPEHAELVEQLKSQHN